CRCRTQPSQALAPLGGQADAPAGACPTPCRRVHWQPSEASAVEAVPADQQEDFHVQGFRKFILRGNVVDLAVAVVIGAAFGSVVQALVKDLITPLIGAFGGVPDFSAQFFTVNSSKVGIGDS